MDLQLLIVSILGGLAAVALWAAGRRADPEPEPIPVRIDDDRLPPD